MQEMVGGDYNRTPVKFQGSDIFVFVGGINRLVKNLFRLFEIKTQRSLTFNQTKEPRIILCCSLLYSKNARCISCLLLNIQSQMAKQIINITIIG